MVRRPIPVLLAILLLAVSTLPAQAQSPPKHEFRGAWIATVLNLDWPSSSTAPPSRQKEGLRELLDSLKAAGINTVLFQVRTEADALYESDLEPWSYWLTGEQGRPPSSDFDPLRFALAEAHDRGLELHAWFNPFRARRAGSDYIPAATHVVEEHPDWLLQFDDGLHILNPGLPRVRDYITRVVMDVARRYDIDGVHFDDYFYPYPPNEMSQDATQAEDQETFEQHSRGFEDIGNWRRDNINRFVRQVRDSIRAEKPRIAFGISPFGIWKDGVPPGATGFSAFHRIYADAVAWLEAQTVDYLAPQLYWEFGGRQDYSALATWWAGQASAHGRHLYPGLAAYKSPLSKRLAAAKKRTALTFSQRAAGTLGKDDFSPGVVPRQIRLNRSRSDVQGSILFRTRNISGPLADTLRENLYSRPALPPSLPARSPASLAPPRQLTYARPDGQGEEVLLQWDPPSSEGTSRGRRYVVYRVRASAPPDFEEAMTKPENLFAVTGQTTLADRPVRAQDPYHYAVTTVGTNSEESMPSASVTVEGRATPDVEALAVQKNVPNPFTDHTSIQMTLPAPATVSVTIYDLLGRRVRRVRESLPAGTERRLDIRGAALSSGVYFYRVTARFEEGGQEEATGRMVRVQ